MGISESIIMGDADQSQIIIRTKNKFKFIGGEDELVEFGDDGGNKISISSYHSPDCCEYNYLSGRDLNETLMTELETNVFIIEFIDGFGIKVGGIPIPCYSEQNGYYSSLVNLEISYFDANRKTEDIIHSREIECEEA